MAIVKKKMLVIIKKITESGVFCKVFYWESLLIRLKGFEDKVCYSIITSEYNLLMESWLKKKE